MPFKSAKQRSWMYANKPEMAKKWASEAGMANLPHKVMSPKLKKQLTKHGLSKNYK